MSRLASFLVGKTDRRAAAFGRPVRCFKSFVAVALFVLFSDFGVSSARAGGSGFNVVVVANQASSNSLQVANYYCEKRQVPPQNVLLINWTGTNTSWTSNDFQTVLLQPLLNLISGRQLTNQIEYVVLSMDIPFQTSVNGNYNATTSDLFYGLKPDLNAASNQNSYATSESSFDFTKPTSAQGYSFLTTMITGPTVTDALSLIDRGNADGAFPSQPVILEKTSDASRNARYSQFDNAIFNARIIGRPATIRTNSDVCPPGPSFGFETGLASLSIPTGAFAAGSMADSLTSFGGIIFGDSSGQTTLFAFTQAGAAATYGTVAEPYGDPSKFPSPLDYFYQGRGFSMGESYYQSVVYPFIGLTLGDPLCAPFALPAQVKWTELPTNSILNGSVEFSVSAAGPQPISQIDVFVDGTFFKTVTNIGPAAGNVMQVTLDGYTVSYPVPANATFSNITAGLAAALNNSWVSSNLKVQAVARGDRVELRSLSTNYVQNPWHFADVAVSGTGVSYAVQYVPFPDTPQIAALMPSSNGLFRAHLETAPGIPLQVQASTNLSNWVTITSNSFGGAMDFIDADSLVYRQRFYRLAAPASHLTLSSSATAGGANIHAQSQTVQGYTIQASTNLHDWFPVFTNSGGGAADFIDTNVLASPSMFYRGVIIPTVLSPATLSVTSNPSGGDMVNVAMPQRAYTLLRSTNQGQWYALATNSVLDGGYVSAGSSIGTGSALTTFLTVAQPRYLDSLANGLNTFSIRGTPSAGSWIQLTVTQTNGNVIKIGVTNADGGASLAVMMQQLYSAVNSATALQGADGLLAQDFSTTINPQFVLAARSPGLLAANIQAQLTGSSGLIATPGSKTSLTSNLTDLRPRNHLYVSAGAQGLSSTFSLDTSLLSDGHHDIAVVAYDGTSVRTQSRTNIAAVIQNSALTATMTRLDLPDAAPVNATYHIQVSANTNTVSTISLYSTGGLIGSATSQTNATFAVDGLSLGIGQHPFYAIVVTGDGLQYRTQPQVVRFVGN
jgi:uncharacterized protein (TIGR03790 family)